MTQEELKSQIARSIGYRFALMVAGNNQPCMSGDPRDRIPAHKRRIYDEACTDLAEEIVDMIQKDAEK